MNKSEKAAMIKALQEAMRINLNPSYSYPHPTYQFNRGFEAGIECAMRAAGFSDGELTDLWYNEQQRKEAERKAEAARTSTGAKVEDHDHFQVRYDEGSKVYVIIAKPHVVEWKVMPWDVHASIQAAEQRYNQAGYRYAELNEEV